MTLYCGSYEKIVPDLAETKHWERREAKSAAFLLVIPGSTIIGFGIGLLSGHTTATTVIGFGAGLLIWGLIVALTK
ncbi:MAG TPA: hypothetical protein VLG39_08400 [Nitrospirota bacterium]|nr:hypothetical protein [Nitrospirota bacterium]